MDVLTALKEARKLISSPEKWTKNAYARDKYGCELHDPTDEGAVCFCSVGALRKVLDIGFGTSLPKTYRESIDELGRTLGPMTLVVTFNDYNDHKDVLDMFDKTIERLEMRNARS